MNVIVGSMVHYHTPDFGPQAAVVTRVWSENVVNLNVFHDAYGLQHKTSVHRSDSAEPGRWSWFPLVTEEPSVP